MRVAELGVVGTIMSRNLRLFFRDRLNVFFSLLSAIILFGLYTLFLGNLQVDAIGSSFPQADEGDVRAFVDSWMFAGIVVLTTITTPLGALSVFVEDSGSGRVRDFLVSPIRRGQLVLGYLGSTVTIAVVLTAIVLVASLVYLLAVDRVVLDPMTVLRVVGWIVLACTAFSALWAFVASFLHSTGAFAALSTIIGTVIGFIAGAYIPVGVFPEAIRTIVNVLPFGQSAILVRQEFTAGTLSELAGGHPQAVERLEAEFGTTAAVGDWQVTDLYVVAVLVAMTVGFTALAAWRIRTRIA